MGTTDDRRMSDAEGLMWRLETDPTFASSFATVTLLDRPADLHRLRTRMARAVKLVPKMRQRVQERPYGLPPVWVDVPEVDLDVHVRPVHLRAPGSVRQLLDLAVEVLAEPFDRDRPLWEFLVVDGVEDGKGAFVQKMHHAITDGVGGIKLSMQFLDLERHAPDPPPLTEEELDAAAPRPAPTPADAVAEAMGNGLRLSIGAAQKLTELAFDPRRLVENGSSLVSRARSTVATLSDTGSGPRSSVLAGRSLGRHLEALQVPLDPVKQAAHHFGGTVNVALLTAAAAATGAYLRARGEPMDHLRASMAISTRSEESASNAFTLARLPVPTGDLDVAERFAQVQAAADDARASAGEGASFDAIAGLAAALPTSLLLRLARQQTGSVDFATSNVRAAPFPLYYAGARILENYPVGPLAGVAFNLTLMSYCGNLDMGLHVDPAAVADPGLLRSLMVDAFDDLVSAASKPKRRKRGEASKAAKASKGGAKGQAKDKAKTA
jgi:WS/DGAT/MGAT family acyltransferase